MSLPLVTRFGADPIQDLEVANKRYVDSSGGGGIVSVQTVVLSSDFSTTSLTFVDITGFSVTLATITDGRFLGTTGFALSHSSANQNIDVRCVDGTTEHEPQRLRCDDAANLLTGGFNQPCSGNADGDTLKYQTQVGTGTGKIRGGGNGSSRLEVLEAG